MYVANLPLDVDDELITKLFGEYGNIERIVLSKNLPTAVLASLAYLFMCLLALTHASKETEGLRICKL